MPEVYILNIWDPEQNKYVGIPAIKGDKGDKGDPSVTEASIAAALGYKPVNAFYVTVTPASPDDQTTGTADKTDAEIYAAYEAGSPVFCNIASAGHYNGVSVMLPLSVANKLGDVYMFIFRGSGATLTSAVKDRLDVVTVTKNDQGWRIFYDTLQEELIYNTTTTEAVQTFSTTVDNNGNALNLKKWVLEIYYPFANPGNYWSYINITVPGGRPGSSEPDEVQVTPLNVSKESKYGAFWYEGSVESGVGRWISTTDGEKGALIRVLNNLTSISMRVVDTANSVIPVGTKITLRGIRA